MSGATGLAATVDQRLRQAGVELEQHLAAGQKHAVEAVLAAHPDLAADTDSALQLVYDELVRRERRGERPAYEEYFDRFPAWRDELSKSFDIHEALVRGSAAPDAPPSQIAPSPTGRYELLHEIGRGGMGVVYQARQLGLNRVVALKLILAGDDADPQTLSRFRREAETAARLHHPNIVHVYEIGEQDGRPFLAMEFVAGGNLADRLNEATLPAVEAAQVVATLARAVQFAHDHGVVHRDLKPSNILLQFEDGVTGADEPDHSLRASCRQPLSSVIPKIADFGLAKQLTSGPNASTARGQTQTGAVLGTPNYMAPEQARSALDSSRATEIGPAADVWALGVILYEALTGRPPFQSDSPLETLVQVESADPLSLCRLQPRVPRDLETICLKCLEKDARKRYASASELADDLQRFLAFKPIRARPISAVAKAWRWCQRKPAVAALTGALAAMALASVTGLTYLWLRAERLGEVAVERRREAEANLGEAVRQQQRAQDSYQIARTSLEECVQQITGDPRLASGPLEDLRRKALEAEVHFFERFVALQGEEVEFQAERGMAFTRLGDVSAELGDQKRAGEHYRQAKEIYTELVRLRPTQPKYRSALAACCHHWGKMLANMGEYAAAEELTSFTLATHQALATEYPRETLHRQNVAITYGNLGAWSLRRLTRAREADPATRAAHAKAAEQALRQAADNLDQLVQQFPADLSLRQPWAAAHINMSNLYFELGRLADADASAKAGRKVLLDLISVTTNAADLTQARAALARAMNVSATIAMQADRPDDAERDYRDALAQTQQLVSKHPMVWSYTVSLGNIEGNIGNLIRLGGKPEPSLEWFLRSIATLNPLLLQNPQDSEVRSFLRNAHVGCSAALTQLQRYPEVLPHLDRALELDDGRFQVMARLARAETRARLKDHTRGTAEAEALLRDTKSAHPGVLFGAAKVYALSLAAVDPNEASAEQYAARAVALLRHALAAGYRGIERVRNEPDFALLRSRRPNELAELLLKDQPKPPE